MDADELEIRKLIAEWQEATRAGDLDRVLALMDGDARFLTPGNPPMTKNDFASGFRGFAGRVRIDAQQTIHEIRTSGELAYCWSTLDIRITPLDGGDTKHRAGDVLTLFRRSPAGKWLLFRDANLLTAQ
jgi:uncharacterized protein (TIGR02246 family)